MVSAAAGLLLLVLSDVAARPGFAILPFPGAEIAPEQPIVFQGTGTECTTLDDDTLRLWLWARGTHVRVGLKRITLSERTVQTACFAILRPVKPLTIGETYSLVADGDPALGLKTGLVVDGTARLVDVAWRVGAPPAAPSWLGAPEWSWKYVLDPKTLSDAEPCFRPFFVRTPLQGPAFLIVRVDVSTREWGGGTTYFPVLDGHIAIDGLCGRAVSFKLNEPYVVTFSALAADGTLVPAPGRPLQIKETTTGYVVPK